MYLLDIEPLDLGEDVKAVGLDLVEADANREPVRGSDASRIWSRVLPVIAGEKAWTLDFFSHLDRVKDFCERHQIAFREASQRSLVVPSPGAEALESLIDRFQNETFGVRAGGPVDGGAGGDPALEGELARRGVDAYHTAYPKYLFCAICGFEDGSLVLLSERLGAGEVIRRVRPALQGTDVQIHLPA